MEGNRCNAIGVNGRHCSKPINADYGDLCTTHGKMAQQGKELARFQTPPVATLAVNSPAPVAVNADFDGDSVREQLEARRIQLQNASQTQGVPINRPATPQRTTVVIPRAQFTVEALQREFNAVANEVAAAIRDAPPTRPQINNPLALNPPLRNGVMQMRGRDLRGRQAAPPPGAPQMRPAGIFQGEARVVGPVPRPGEQVVMMTEAQFRALTLAREPNPLIGEIREPLNAGDATMAKLLGKINATKPVEFHDRLGTDCPICQEAVKGEEKDFGLPCGHDMHVECGAQLQNDQCPMCRQEFSRLRDDTEVNKAIILAIKTRKANAKEASRREGIRVTEDMIRTMMQPLPQWREVDTDGDEMPPLQDDTGSDDDEDERQEGRYDELPERGSGAWDALVSQVIEEYVSDEEYQEDSEYFHQHLHHTFRFSCADLYILQGEVRRLLQ